MTENESKRLVEQCLPALDNLRDIQPETEEQEEKIEDAIESLEWVMDDDRERHGAGPTDKLVSALEARDGDE